MINIYIIYMYLDEAFIFLFTLKIIRVYIYIYHPSLEL